MVVLLLDGAAAEENSGGSGSVYRRSGSRDAFVDSPPDTIPSFRSSWVTVRSTLSGPLLLALLGLGQGDASNINRASPPLMGRDVVPSSAPETPPTSSSPPSPLGPPRLSLALDDSQPCGPCHLRSPVAKVYISGRNFPNLGDCRGMLVLQYCSTTYGVL